LPTLILLRHGQSQWNLADKFTGWVDVDLTPQGEAEARKGGELIKAAGLAMDVCYTSVLTRAIRTSWLALHAADQTFVPEIKDWRLNSGAAPTTSRRRRCRRTAPTTSPRTAAMPGPSCRAPRA
jgi:bisphosphoglycerate-dependent phosphoglycerate mutase family 1